MKNFIIALALSSTIILNANAGMSVKNPLVLFCMTEQDYELATKNKRTMRSMVNSGECAFLQYQFEFDCIDCPVMWGPAYIRVYGSHGGANIWVGFETLKRNSINGKVH